MSRRHALRVLGAGVALALPFTALIRTARAEPAAPAGLHVRATSFETPPALTARMATITDTLLWSDPAGSLPLGVAPPAAIFEPLAMPVGQLVPARDAYSSATSFLDPSNLTPVDAAATLAAPGRWWGQLTVDAANLRSAPSRRAPIVGQLPAGSPLVVTAWVAGDQIVADNPTWGQINENTFIYSAEIRPVDLPSPPPAPVDAPQTGRWIDVNLTQQVVVAYEGRAIARVARTSTGRPGFETPPGGYAIQHRVASETMTSAGIPGASYYVPHVRWTQYFSADGMALHENYWKASDDFGIPSSHGCAGLRAADAQFLWDWATVGTPVLVHA